MIPKGWEIIVENRQRARRLDRRLLKQLIDWLLVDELSVEQAELGFHFVTPREMARVHQDFMNIPGSTDVITFDHSAESGDGVPPLGGPIARLRLHGEIFISIEDAIAQAKEFKSTWQSETARYVIHGILHLLGYDDLQPKLRVIMKREENRLLRAVEKRFDLRQLEAAKTQPRRRRRKESLTPSGKPPKSKRP